MNGRRRQLIRPNKRRDKEDVGISRGGYFSVLGADDDSDSESHASLEEPLADTDVEVSSGEEKDDDGEGEAESANGDVPENHQEDERAEYQQRARGITRPLMPTKSQLERHYLEGHANYLAGCEYCARCRGRADKHFHSDKSSKEYLAGEDAIPTVSVDFAFLAQEIRIKRPLR